MLDDGYSFDDAVIRDVSFKPKPLKIQNVVVPNDQVWIKLFSLGNININKEDVLTLASHNMSGKMIRNIIKSAQDIAKNESSDVELRHLNIAIDLASSKLIPK